MKYLTIALSLMICLTFVSAYYPGDTITIENDFGVENLVYTVIENSTAVDVNVSINSTHVIVRLPFDMAPDSFTIVFLEEQTKEVIKEVYIGGGGSSRRTVIKEVPVESNCTIIIQDQQPPEPEEPINLTTDEPEEEKKEFDKKWYGVLMMVIIFFAVLMFWLYLILKKNKKIKKKFKEFISSFS